MDDVPGEVTSGLIDLRELDLTELEALDNPVLIGTLAKVLDELGRGDEATARFNSSL